MMSVEKSSSFNSNHPLYKFRRKQRRWQIFVYVMIIITFVLIPLNLFQHRNFIDKTDATLIGITLFVLLGSILFLAYYNMSYKKRTRYHRYYGPTDELLNKLEDYFHKKNLSYNKNKKFPYKFACSLKSVDAIKYEFNDFSVVVLPLESLRGNYCELLIYMTIPKNELIIEEIERDIFVLIKEKRGWKRN